MSNFYNSIQIIRNNTYVYTVFQYYPKYRIFDYSFFTKNIRSLSFRIFVLALYILTTLLNTVLGLNHLYLC